MSWGWEIDPPDKAYDVWLSWHPDPEEEPEEEPEEDEYDERE